MKEMALVDIKAELSAAIHKDHSGDVPGCEHPLIYENLTVNDDRKIALIEQHFAQILQILGLDLTNDSLAKTPFRFAKMIVQELFTGLKSENFPKITTQQNSFGYHEMLIEANINIKSVCEHHFMPIIGVCHIAYIPQNKVIGLSKLNRIAQYYARRPQVQERMTKQIEGKLIELLETEDVAVVIDALHLCVRMRGVQDTESLTRTSGFSGRFNDMQYRKQFLDSIPKLSSLKL